MKLGRRIRLLEFLPETRILAAMPPLPEVKALFTLAELVVRDACVKDPLEFYNDLANQPPPWIAPSTDSRHSRPKIQTYQVCTSTVRRLTAAIALSQQGFGTPLRSTTHIIVLIAAPSHALRSHLALLSHVVRLLDRDSRRERLLGCSRPEDVRACIEEFEGESQAAVTQ